MGCANGPPFATRSNGPGGRNPSERVVTIAGNAHSTLGYIVGRSILWCFRQHGDEAGGDSGTSADRLAPSSVAPCRNGHNNDIGATGTNVLKGNDHQTLPDRRAAPLQQRQRGALGDLGFAAADGFLQ